MAEYHLFEVVKHSSVGNFPFFSLKNKAFMKNLFISNDNVKEFFHSICAGYNASDRAVKLLKDTVGDECSKTGNCCQNADINE